MSEQRDLWGVGNASLGEGRNVHAILPGMTPEHHLHQPQASCVAVYSCGSYSL